MGKRAWLHKQKQPQKHSPFQEVGKGQLVREEDTPGEWKNIGGQAGRRQGEDKVLCEAGEKISQDQSKPLISTEQKKTSGKPPKVQMSGTSQFGSCYSF